MDTLMGGTAVVLFDEQLTEISFRSPWYYFSGGVVLKIRGQHYRVSFGRPADPSSSDIDLQTVSTMRHVGKQWLRALNTK